MSRAYRPAAGALALSAILGVFASQSRAESAPPLRPGRDCGVIGSAFFAMPDASVRAMILYEFETTRLGSSQQSCAQGNPKTYANMKAALASPTTPKPAPSAPAKPGSTNAGARGGGAVVTSTPSGGQRCAPELEYTNYKQAQGAWADEPVHPGYMTFSRTACHLVAWTTAMRYYGYDYDPTSFRDELDRTGGWQSGYSGSKVHPKGSALETLAKGKKFVKLRGRADQGKHNAAALAAVRQHFCVDRKGEPMVGNVDYESDDDDRGNHFVTIIGYQDGEPIVLDPGSADTAESRVSGAKLPSNAAVKSGVLLSDVRRPKQGHYYLTGLEYVE